MLVGVLSDTHGKLHPRALPVLREAAVEHILHAGDVGDYTVITQLSALAPVSAVRGNVDRSGQVASLPRELRMSFAEVDIFVTHIGARPAAWLGSLPNPRPQVAICGHSHMPLLEKHEGVLFLNPGSAGTQPRFGLPLTLAILRVESGGAEAEVIEL